MSGRAQVDLSVRLSQRQSRKVRTESFDIQSTCKDISQAESHVLTKSAPFHKFVLTGGPCGGKTTALARLSSYLRERGFEVITVPEAFTILASNGFSMDYFAVDGMPSCVQNTVMDMQMALEDSFERVLRAKGKPGVLLCDRGLCDGAAYVSNDDWDRFLVRRGVSSAEIREGRYNAVFHLVTAAEGAEKYYTLDNNDARTESPEEARNLDKQTRAAWVGHPKLFVIDNATDFEGKLNKIVEIASEMVGLPSTSKQITVKYLLSDIPSVETFPTDVKYHLFEVEKVYLYDLENEKMENDFAEEYSFIRKRTHLSRDGRRLGSSYGLTTVHITHDGKHIEVKRIITPREYNTAFKNRDTSRHVVKQKRMSFIWNMQSFNVHTYSEPLTVESLCIVHVQQQSGGGVGEVEDKNGSESETGGGDSGSTPSRKVNMPEFLQVDRKLIDCKEDNEKYGAFNISRRT